MIELKYRPDVDGLRAVAVIMVLLFHAGLGFSGGYVGVDVFFVISGFLITGLILKEQSLKRFSLAEFWGRRIRRIIPAATLVGVVCLIAGGVLLLPSDWEQLAKSLVAQQAMLSNVYFWRSTDYFAGPSEVMPLLHTWSLAVEEQFYLGFPLLLIVIRRLSPRTAASVLLSLAAFSFLLSEWAVRRYPSAAFFLLPTRAWELLLGALLVYCPEPRQIRRGWKELGAWTGLIFVVGSGTWFSSDTTFPGISAMLPCLGTFMIIYFNAGPLTSLGTALADKKVVFVGLISYSLYLWHWPILAFTRYWMGIELPLGIRIGALVVSFLFAVVSWKFVETPFRRGFAGVGTAKLAAGAVASAAIVVGVSQWVQIAKGFPARLPEDVRKIAEPLAVRLSYGVNVHAIRDGKLPVLGLPRAAERPPDFIVWGDSHAMAIGACFESLAKEHQLCGVVAARTATVPILGVWRPNHEGGFKALDWNDAVLNYIRENRVKNVILVARWAVNIDGRQNGQTDSLIAERDSKATNPESARAALENGLRRTLDELEKLGARVWILKQVPLQDFSPQRAIVRSTYLGWEFPKGVSIAEHDAQQKNSNEIIDRQALGRRNVEIIDPTPACFDVDGHSVLGTRYGSYYCDETHLSDLGANELLRPLFESALNPLIDTKVSE